MQTLHTKFMVRQPVRKDYGPMNISADAGVLFGIVAGLIVLYCYMNNHESLTWWNFMIAFIVSSLQMISVFLGQNSSVKGLAGPTLAIIYS